MSDDHLLLNGITKTYKGNVVANDAVNMEIRRGEVFGLLGPNGAGKTTLVSQIIGLSRPDSGSIRYGGIDLVREPAMARRLCSYLPQTQIPVDSVPLGTAVELIGRMRGGRADEVRSRTRELFENLEIEEWRTKPGSRVSGGVLRLVEFALATVWPGAVVILDEPTNDVDPLRRRLLWRQVRNVADMGHAVLLVTHNVMEAERAVDRLAILDCGRILAQGTPVSLSREKGGGSLRLEVTLEPEALEWARSRKAAGSVETFVLGPSSLEDTYLQIMGRGDVARPDAAPGIGAGGEEVRA
jgi:ABC-2 type transport system ATP-binding protein